MIRNIKKRVLPVGIAVMLALSLTIFAQDGDSDDYGRGRGRRGFRDGGRGNGGKGRGQGRGMRRGRGRNRGRHLENLKFTGKGPLSKSEVRALGLALNDEYKAIAVYTKVMKDFGNRRPFSNIIRAEKRHVRALLSLYKYYKISVPKTATYNISGFKSFRDALQTGVKAEIENAGLYKKLFSMTKNPDLLMVFKNLRDASRYNHLSAFRRNLARQ